jgi:hypothetical protein
MKRRLRRPLLGRALQQQLFHPKQSHPNPLNPLNQSPRTSLNQSQVAAGKNRPMKREGSGYPPLVLGEMRTERRSWQRGGRM